MQKISSGDFPWPTRPFPYSSDSMPFLFGGKVLPQLVGCPSKVNISLISRVDMGPKLTYQHTATPIDTVATSGDMTQSGQVGIFLGGQSQYWVREALRITWALLLCGQALYENDIIQGNREMPDISTTSGSSAGQAHITSLKFLDLNVVQNSEFFRWEKYNGAHTGVYCTHLYLAQGQHPHNQTH